MSEQMVLHLHGFKGEEKIRFTASIVPWKLMKRAVKIYSTMKAGELTEENIQDLTSLVVDVFGNQFSVDDVE
jgi:hypothetical protein